MNNKYKTLVRGALLVALGSLMYVGGCGPQNPSDLDYLDQTAKSVKKTTLDETDEPNAAAEMPMKEGEMRALPVMEEPTTMPVAEEPAEEPAMEAPATEEPAMEAPAAEEPAMEAPVEEPAAMPAEEPAPQGPRMIRPAMPVVVGPTTVIREPSRLIVKPTNVVNTAGMDIYDQNNVLVKRKIHVVAPTEIINPLRRHHNTTEFDKTKVVIHPVESTVVPVSDYYTANREVLPTEVVTRPVRQVPAVVNYAPVAPVAYPSYPAYGYGYGVRSLYIHPWYRRFWL